MYLRLKHRSDRRDFAWKKGNSMRVYCEGISRLKFLAHVEEKLNKSATSATPGSYLWSGLEKNR